MPSTTQCLLLYASPLLLNGTLLLLAYVKEKNSHYTQIAEGLGFLLGLLGLGLLLNLAAGVLALLYQHYGLGVVYLAIFLLTVSLLIVSRNS